MMEQNQSEIKPCITPPCSPSPRALPAQSNVDNVQAQIDALNTGANDYYIYAPYLRVIHMDTPTKRAWC